MGDSTQMSRAINLFIQEWGILINVGLGIAALLGLLSFGYALTLLIMNADKPQQREDAIRRLWMSGIGTAITGGFWVVVTLVYGAFL